MLRNKSGNVLFTSEVIDENPNPEWSEAEVGLQPLCRCDFDAPIEFAIYHKDAGKERELVGSSNVSVNEIVVAANSGESIAVTKDGDVTGRIQIVQAKVIGFNNPWEVLRATANIRDLSEAASLVAESKAHVAQTARKELEKAQLTAEERRKSEQIAMQELHEAQLAAEELKTKALKAAEEAKMIKQGGLQGILKFQFAGRVKNVETYSWLGDKSDPFFVIERVASEEYGKLSWSPVFTSNVIENQLDPEWEPSELDIREICKAGLDEAVRVVVFDHENSGKHQLIGFFETTVNDIISAMKASVEIPLMDGIEEVGCIRVLHAELDNFVNPQTAEQRAEELAHEADCARFFAMGREQRSKIASETAKAAQTDAQQIQEGAEVTAEQAEWAKRFALEKTVTKRLGELGLIM